MKKFNVTGLCIPKMHYMVDTAEMIREITTDYIDCGEYFTINRGRQYGKTTTLDQLYRSLRERYLVLRVSFEGKEELFASHWNLAAGLSRKLQEGLKRERAELADVFAKPVSEQFPMGDLSERITELCTRSEKKVLLLVDEVDQASDYGVFLNFLGLLRDKYLLQRSGEDATFWSVILAGVHDIRHIRAKIRPEEKHSINSPWNIAAAFSVDMSLCAVGIEGMLKEYEAEHHIGMDAKALAAEIYNYTSGYPVLVSLICKIIDERLVREGYFDSLRKAWSRDGVVEAVGILLNERNWLFDSLQEKVEADPRLKKLLRRHLLEGAPISYSATDLEVDRARMYGFLQVKRRKVSIANRIFEMWLYEMLLHSDEAKEEAFYTYSNREKYRYIKGDTLDMELILTRFIEVFHDVYGKHPQKFLEEDGRRFFLLFVRPIINGVGNYYVEARTRDMERTDLVLDYLGTRYVVEMKIWRGNAYFERGEQQLLGYLDQYHLDKGYLLSFNFNENKTTGLTRHRFGERVLVEAVV